MTTRRQPALMAALRAETACFAALCVMVLSIPVVLSVARAQAFPGGLVMCTQAGVIADAQHPDPLSMHADCTCVVTCHGCAAGKIAKALKAGSALADTTPGRVARWSPDRESQRLEIVPESAANAIRGPPTLV